MSDFKRIFKKTQRKKNTTMKIKRNIKLKIANT